MKIKTHKNAIYLFLFIAVFITLNRVTPTFAKFSNDYVTDNDIVGLDLNFDVKLSNIEEYEEIRVDSKSYEIYNINISNSTSQKTYYGVWYKMVSPKEITKEITIARLEDNRVSLNGELDAGEDKTVTIMIKNTSTDDIIINIGIASSESSIQDIEYLGGKHLITGTLKEIDYYYDNVGKKYISSNDSNTNFVIVDQMFLNPNQIETYTTNHTGVFRVEALGANINDQKGLYTSGTIKLEPTDKLYLYIGEKNKNTTDIRLASGDREDNTSSNSTIMKAGTSLETTYISGYTGTKNHNLDASLKDKCEGDSKDIICSYHQSGKIFHNTKVVENPNTNIIKDNEGNGIIKITPIVPTLEIPQIKVAVGFDYDTSKIKCIDNGTGCYIVKIQPESTKDLVVGTYNLNVIIMDDDGLIYRYTTPFEIVE